MAKSSRSKCSKYELGAYLAVGMGSLSVVSGTEAGVVSININAFGINGANGGAALGDSKLVANFPTSGQGKLVLSNTDNLRDLSGRRERRIGIYGADYTTFFPTFSITPGIKIAVDQIGVYGKTTKFSVGASIGASSTFSQGSPFFFRDSGDLSTYKYSPDFGAGSYVGFKTKGGNYGYLEVTWSRTSKEFFILSGAYESTPNTPILAGATPGGGGGGEVPEPASGAIAALLMGGTALRQWRKKRREEANEAIAS